ncbi:hypothetical protein L1987_31974 [Smallanthus sonchifolius]|uniref:Uncharacterized protein n=1 Tax=Smallanthus sonchifolius TaxID=185202 RepID=A0ACB9I6X4_9ASTR|nr:hypothetical protein L1987_31974 [Smallanthus sonchifolius]
MSAVDDTAGGNIPVEQVINILSESYKSSDIYREVKSEIAAICGQEEGLTEKTGSLQASSITQCLVLVKRSFINMYRDLGYYWLRLGIYIVMGFAIGTIFYNLGSGYESLNARISILMFVSSFLSLLAIGGFPSFMEEMKPYDLFNSLSTCHILNLHREREQFIFFALVLFASMLLVECLMLIVATIVPNLLIGIISGAGIQGLRILGAGFFRFPNDLPQVFWRYPMYYVSFHRALEALSMAIRFGTFPVVGDMISGPTNLSCL